MSPTPHWKARLELGYAHRDGRTLPVHRRHEGPLRVQKHFEPEPGLCEHILVHPPAGLAGGDELDLDLRLGPSSRVRITTPGATKWYRSEGIPAFQRVHARLDKDSALEWLPEPQILFSGARARVSLRFDLHPSSRLIAWDVTVFGRKAGDLPFEVGDLQSRLDVLIDGESAFTDRLVLTAGDPLFRSPLGLDHHDVLGTLLLVGPPLRATVLEEARALRPEGLSLGLTQLPSVLVVRLLSNASELATRHLKDLWTLFRPHLLGAPARPCRIWST
jgi:urease accessory protein